MSLAVPVCDDVVWRVGLDIGYVSYTSRWQCRRVSYGVPSLGWTTHPWTRVSTWKSYVLAKQSPGWIVFLGTLVWREVVVTFGSFQAMFEAKSFHLQLGLVCSIIAHVRLLLEARGHFRRWPDVATGWRFPSR
ncbi:unnamed protein product [Prunus armeniaca]